MNLNTERMKRYKPLKPLSARQRTVSQEYYALAVLKYLYPEKYTWLSREKDDKPDLKSHKTGLGVEVTTVDFKEDNQDSQEFADKADMRKAERDDLKTTSEDVYIKEYNLRHLAKGGGYSSNRDNATLIECIKKKLKSACSYMKNWEKLELFIIKNELVPSVWEEEIFNCIKEALRDADNVFETIYVMYKNTCYCYSVNDGESVLNVMQNGDLKKLGNMTAQKIINDTDIEWKN